MSCTCKHAAVLQLHSSKSPFIKGWIVMKHTYKSRSWVVRSRGFPYLWLLSEYIVGYVHRVNRHHVKCSSTAIILLCVSLRWFLLILCTRLIIINVVHLSPGSVYLCTDLFMHVCLFVPPPSAVTEVPMPCELCFTLLHVVNYNCYCLWYRYNGPETFLCRQHLRLCRMA